MCSFDVVSLGYSPRKVPPFSPKENKMSEFDTREDNVKAELHVKVSVKRREVSNVTDHDGVVEELIRGWIHGGLGCIGIQDFEKM